MVALAQGVEVPDRGLPTVLPFMAMVALAGSCGGGAAGPHAGGIAFLDEFGELSGRLIPGASDVEHLLGDRVGDKPSPLASGGKCAGNFGGDRTVALELGDRLGVRSEERRVGKEGGERRAG